MRVRVREQLHLLGGRVGLRGGDEEQQVDQPGGARGARALRRWLLLRWLRLRLRRADALGEALDG